MTTKKKTDKNQAKKTEPSKKEYYSPLQACAIFRLSGINRKAVLAKYKGKNFTKDDWKKFLKSDNISFWG